ncbi:hypothetical protein [Actinoallomurus rhizosphaericola]|uniref:hypothetical protein n=1 Tax=Actinoallomurus rhizosphaericola TaxID=2952536 RepID=UPI0020934667|nr:hypothetical protein [Actinoallomurus rhizosphaericola]MCO5996142.1 hypothetical protein [Actinoallomurus rhizosphaericola]
MPDHRLPPDGRPPGAPDPQGRPPSYGPPPEGTPAYGRPPEGTGPYGPPAEGTTSYGPPSETAGRYGPPTGGTEPYGPPGSPYGPSAQGTPYGPPGSPDGPSTQGTPYASPASPYGAPGQGAGPYGSPVRPYGPADGGPGPYGPGEAPDPLEETRSDRPRRAPRRRLGPRGRRTAEAVALAILLPALIVTQVTDDRHQNANRERISTVPRGATVTIDHMQWRLLGRVPSTGRPTASGAVSLVLLLEVRPLDAQGVKQAEPFNLTFRVRDGKGHQWSAGEDDLGAAKPVVGRAAQVKVTAVVPQQVVAAAVLELRAAPALQPGPGDWVRFAH